MTDHLDIGEAADELAALYRESFGGKGAGKFRISRKYLRQIARRQRLPEEYLRSLAIEMFERGFVLVDLESFFVVMDQKLFSSYRRVTGPVISRVEAGVEDRIEPLSRGPNENILEKGSEFDQDG